MSTDTKSSETTTPSAQPGYTSYVASHLVRWITHRRPGIVWVDYWSDEIRDRAIEQVDATCRAAEISVERIEVKAAFGRRDWEQVRDRLEGSAGVVHVLFPALFNKDLLESNGVRDFAIALNLDRERIFSANASQIWWVSRPFSDLVRPFAPDFLSWVHARFALNELPPFVARNRSSSELMTHLDRELNASRASPQQKGPEAIPQAPLGDPRLLDAHELRWRSEDLLTAGKLKEALALASEAVYGFRQSLAIGESAQNGLAGSLDLLARVQSRLGQRQQALASSTEAVRHYRALVEADPDSFLPLLAGALNNLANMQGDMGQRAEALASITEAVGQYRALAEGRPDAFLPDLAGSLNNLANAQADMGQRAEALASIAEAVRLRRALAEASPDVFLPGLATSLNNLANRQSGMGQRAEALASITEAVQIRRGLAEAKPDAFLPDLAGSLNNLANRQSGMGRRAEALASTTEAVRHYRALIEANPDAFLPDLAGSLNNLANRQSDMGQRAEALAAIAEAVRLRRALAEANPDAFLPDLARSLNNLANIQSDMGQRAEALASIAEAVRLRRTLAEANPDAFLPDLAMSLNNLANMQSDMGQRAEALASITEAARQYRALAEANPDAFLPDLARSLSVLGDCLAALERLSEARDAARESLACLAPSFARFPGAFDGLAKAVLEDYMLRTQVLGEEPEEQVLSPYRDLFRTETQVETGDAHEAE
jgi:hypothetical protein